MIELVILLGIISIIDTATQKIPVVVLIFMAGVGIVCAVTDGKALSSVAIAVIPGIVLFAAAFMTKQQIGYGDAVVIILMGLFVTADVICSALIMGLSIAGVISVLMIAFKKSDLKKQIAFTPFLLLGYGLTGVFL
ncbi:prepilin peptidase [Agathobacter sp.]